MCVIPFNEEARAYGDAFSKYVTVRRRTRAAATWLVVENRKQAIKGSRKFPRRPNLHVLSETIPLFYIGQNRHGFWVARDAEGRTGGLFLRKQSALRSHGGKATGCAIMPLGRPVELDIENQGNRIAGPVGVIVDLVIRRVPLFTNLVGMAITEWHRLGAQISYVLVSGRAPRRGRARAVSQPALALLEKRRRPAGQLISEARVEIRRPRCLVAIGWSTAMKSTEMINDNEPPSRLRPPIFLIGRDSRGNWVVHKAGTRAGLFVDRGEALRYIRLESARYALVTVASCLELDMSARAVPVQELGSHISSASSARRVA